MKGLGCSSVGKTILPVTCVLYLPNFKCENEISSCLTTFLLVHVAIIYLFLSAWNKAWFKGRNLCAPNQILCTA